MRKLNLLLLFVMITAMSSCTVIGDIFKAGAVVGILAVVIVLGLIFWIISMFNK